MLVEYRVDNMRAVKPSVKVAENNPDRLVTIHGTFYNLKGEKLSFSSKEITREMAANPDTIIDIENGKLILPAGERGRKPSASVSQADVNSLLDDVRNSAAE